MLECVSAIVSLDSRGVDNTTESHISDWDIWEKRKVLGHLFCAYVYALFAI